MEATTLRINAACRGQTRLLCAVPAIGVSRPWTIQNGGFVRGYLAVGGASQQSRYGLLDGHIFCIFQPVAQTAPGPLAPHI